MLISIIWMIFGAGFYSYTIGTLSSLLVNSHGRRGKLKKKIIVMDAFTKENRLQKVLKRKIHQALVYNSARAVFNQFEKYEFLIELPTNLKFEIARSLYSNLNSKIIFLKNKEKTFLAEFIPCLFPLKFQKGEKIYQKSENPIFGIFLIFFNSKFLVYFIVDGRVSFITGKTKACYKTLVQGSNFGEIEIFEKTLRLHTLQASTECHFLAIRKEEFSRIMANFPDYEEECRNIAKQKIKRINENFDKIQPLLKIKLNSEFWNKRKNIYKMAKEEKENSVNQFKGLFTRKVVPNQFRKNNTVIIVRNIPSISNLCEEQEENENFNEKSWKQIIKTPQKLATSTSLMTFYEAHDSKSNLSNNNKIENDNDNKSCQNAKDIDITKISTKSFTRKKVCFSMERKKIIIKILLKK